jgi:hypothetical protein
MRRSVLAFASLMLASLTFVAPSAFAEEVEGFVPETGRSLALGGMHAALADDFSVLFSNPAGLVAAPRELYVSQLGIKASGPIFDMANAFLSGGDVQTAVTDLLAASGYRLFAGADVAGPIAFGYVGGGLGFGLFNSTNVAINAASASSIGVRAAEDLLLCGGYAFRIALGGGNALDFGLGVKGFVRGEISDSLGAVEFVGLMSDPMALLALPFDLTMGIGIDAGLRWNWDEVVSAGLVCRDAYSPAFVTTYDDFMSFVSNPAAANPVSRNATIDPDLSFGLSWRPRLGELARYLDSLLVALDYRDILDLLAPVPRNPVLNVGLGVETRILEILSVRVGIADALLTAGVGLDFGVVRMNLTAFGTELGIDPGQRPNYNLLASFEFIY